MTDEHPAREAANRSMDAVHRKAREDWLALFASDAVVEDPVGPSPFSPDGKGHAGKEAIAAFWDRLIAPNRVLFQIDRSYAAGSECANSGTITTVMPNGVVTFVHGVFVYRVNEAGKILSLRAFWEFEKMRAFKPTTP